jgi:hypothetical protein
METTGLVIGTVALASLFTACVECFDYVVVARQQARDFQIAQTKLLLVKARVAAWGVAVRASVPGDELLSLRTQWHACKDTIGQSLDGIRKLLEDSKKLQDRYGLTAAVGASEIVQTNELYEIEMAFDDQVLQRKTRTSLLRKATWALHDAKKFDTLITDLEFFVSNLEATLQHLGVGVLTKQHAILEHGLRAIQNPASVRLLLEASSSEARADNQGSQDPPPLAQNEPGLGESQEQLRSVKLESHRFTRNVIEQHARAILGDVGNVGPYASKHEYTDNRVGGNSQAILGNVDGASMAAFFGRTG